MSNEYRFALECLIAHNNYRRLHGSPPLHLSKEMCTKASDWAKFISIEGWLLFDEHCSFGQNLYKSRNSPLSGFEAPRAWYEGYYYYHYDKPGLTLRSKSFTQLIWKTSYLLGVSVYKENDMNFVVALYHPIGNILGEFEANVQPLKHPIKLRFVTVLQHLGIIMRPYLLQLVMKILYDMRQFHLPTF